MILKNLKRFFVIGIVFLFSLEIWVYWWHYSNDFFKRPSEVSTRSGHFSSAKELPISRTEAGGTVCNGKFYVLGGIDGFMRTYTSFMEYDPKTDSWSSLPDLPEPINHPAVTSFGNKIYVAGGFEPLGLRIRWFMFADWKSLNTFYVFDTDTKKWSKAESMPEPRGAGGIAVSENSIWYVGGINQNKIISSSLFKYDLTTQKWSVEPNMPTARDHMRLEAVDGKLYAISGREDDLRKNLTTVECFDIRTNLWTKKADIPIGRGGFASAVLNGKIYTFGGEYTWTCLDQIEEYDPDSDTWKVLDPMPEGRHGIIAGVIGNQIHLVSGGRHPRVSVSGIHRVFEPEGK